MRNGYARTGEFHLENSIGEQLHGQKIEKEYGWDFGFIEWFIIIKDGFKYKRFLITRHQPNAGPRLQEWVEQLSKSISQSKATLISGKQQLGKKLVAKIKFFLFSRQIDAIAAAGEVNDGMGEGGEQQQQPGTSQQQN